MGYGDWNESAVEELTAIWTGRFRSDQIENAGEKWSDQCRRNAMMSSMAMSTMTMISNISTRNEPD